MERRSFLAGLFGGVTAAGVIVAASPGEIAAFAAPLARDEPLVLGVPPTSRPTRVGTGDVLYDKHGKVVAIVTSFTANRLMQDVTSLHDTHRVQIARQVDIDITARWVG